MNTLQTDKEKNEDVSFLDNDFVVILGSGISISVLTDKQLRLINAAKVKIAINKFGGFHKVARIIPTHIYFHDDYTESSILFLKYIFKTLRNDGLKELTFIVSHRYKGFLFSNKITYLFNKFWNYLLINILNFILKLGRFIIKPISLEFFNKFKSSLTRYFKKKSIFRFGLLPKKSETQFIDTQNWKKRNNYWAKNLNQKLYHYRGSFTTVLNYISILYPNKKILLVGVDFNSPSYFFEKELAKLNFTTSDWTTEIVQKNKKHFSIIDFEGTRMDDELPFIINELANTNNRMYSFSEKSYLVKMGFVKYVEI